MTTTSTRTRSVPRQRGKRTGAPKRTVSRGRTTQATDTFPGVRRPIRKYELDIGIKRLTPAERAEKGRKLREQVPRSSHAEFRSDADRPDPVGVLMAQSKGRLPDLIPIRYGRMIESPFSYFRGAALPMAYDLSRTPATGLPVQACGDAHLGNFGLFGSAERRLVFDINDFDETQPGPWEWDVKRLTARLEIAARENGVRKRDRYAMVKAAAARYRTAMRDFASMSNLKVFYASADVDAIQNQLQDRLTSRQRSRLTKGIAKAHSRDSMQALQKL